jgi:tRNA threonylcarbamoyladenosine biosynthesis protein TsaB
MLVPFVDQLLKRTGISANDLDAIAVSKGPGSFTGLRIGVATAKGLCFATGKPLIGVNSLESMAQHFSDTNPNQTNFICPMIDARRMEVYTAMFRPNLDTMEDTHAKILDENSFSEYLSTQKVAFIGNGAKKLGEILNNALIISEFKASSEGMNTPAYSRYLESRFESVAYFEPFYLKDFYNPGLKP